MNNQKSMSRNTTKPITAMLALLMMLSAATTAFAANRFPAQRFTDVPRSNWAYPFVEACCERGWVEGTGGDRFEPQKAVSAAEFAAMLIRALFSNRLVAYRARDGDPWWASYIEAAHTNGLLTLTTVSDAFLENGCEWTSESVLADLSRRDMAQMLANAIDEVHRSCDSSATIPGRASAPETYQEAVLNICYNDAEVGKADGAFRGEDAVSRGEACTVLVRMYRLLYGIDVLTDGATIPESCDTQKPVAG